MKYLTEKTLRLILYTVSLVILIACFTKSGPESYIAWLCAIIWNMVALIDKLAGDE